MLIPSRSFAGIEEGGTCKDREDESGGGGDRGGGGGGVFDLDLGTFGGDGAGISSFSDITANPFGGGAITNGVDGIPISGLVSLGGVEGGAARGGGGGVGNVNDAGGENTFVGSVVVTTVGRNDNTGCSDSTGSVGDMASFIDLLEDDDDDDDDDPIKFFNNDLSSFCPSRSLACLIISGFASRSIGGKLFAIEASDSIGDNDADVDVSVGENDSFWLLLGDSVLVTPKESRLLLLLRFFFFGSVGLGLFFVKSLMVASNV